MVRLKEEPYRRVKAAMVRVISLYRPSLIERVFRLGSS